MKSCLKKSKMSNPNEISKEAVMHMQCMILLVNSI